LGMMKNVCFKVQQKPLKRFTNGPVHRCRI
jgi:hypothetical protein